jgi:hypothetical protein
MTVPEPGSRRTTWPAAVPLQQAADTLREAPFYTGRLGKLADPLADLLEEYLNNLAWLAPYREHEGGYGMWETAMRVANLVNGTTANAVEPPSLPDRCGRCLCEDCGGRLDEHTDEDCTCKPCAQIPRLACRLAEFAPDKRIGFLAEQLGPLLSSHLNEAARVRCLAVAHAAHHALYDYDQRQGARDDRA